MTKNENKAVYAKTIKIFENNNTHFYIAQI